MRNYFTFVPIYFKAKYYILYITVTGPENGPDQEPENETPSDAVSPSSSVSIFTCVFQYVQNLFEIKFDILLINRKNFIILIEKTVLILIKYNQLN